MCNYYNINPNNVNELYCYKVLLMFMNTLACFLDLNTVLNNFILLSYHIAMPPFNLVHMPSYDDLKIIIIIILSVYQVVMPPD